MYRTFFYENKVYLRWEIQWYADPPSIATFIMWTFQADSKSQSRGALVVKTLFRHNLKAWDQNMALSSITEMAK